MEEEVSFNISRNDIFDSIKNAKKYEGRLAKGKFLQMVEGFQVVVKNSNTGEKIKIEVVSRTPYTNFEEMIRGKGLENVLPMYNDVETALNEVYYNFYSKEDELKYGVVAIEMKLI